MTTTAARPIAGEARERIKRVLSLFQEHGSTDYFGEKISQVAHATQGAKCAVDTRADERVVIAILLHDVGHMVSAPNLASMGEYGAVNHEVTGANFLREVGMPELVCNLVQQHVDAKRYLCWKYPAYHNKLSVASKATLVYQGGPMSDAEAAVFSANPLADTILKMRTWDEAAKVPGLEVPGLEAYVEIMERLVESELAAAVVQPPAED